MNQHAAVVAAPAPGLAQALLRAAQVNGDGIATTFGERRRTWREVNARVARLAAGLRSLGVAQGDRVALLAPSSDRYFEVYLACWWLGAVVVPLNTRWAAPEVLFALEDADPRLLCVGEGFADVARQAARERSGRQLLWLQDEAPVGGPTHEGLIRTSEPIHDAGAEGEAIAGIFYTGGTTGRPKGVMLSHRALFMNAMISLADAPFDDRAVLLHYAPLFHLAGLSFLLRGTLRAASHVILDGFTPARVLAAIETHRVSHMFAVPTMLQMLVDAPELATRDLASLQSLSYGSSPITEALLDRVIAALPGVEIFQGYGMTELTAAVTFLAPRHHRRCAGGRGKLRSAGQAKTGIEVRIEGAAGDELAPGGVGEIVVRSPCVMSGYWRRPEETAQALRGGWMHTGDAGWMDADGFVYVVDRLKDMIVTGGENVYSAEVEQALASHPAVAQAAVIGVPSARWGEAVHAVVVPRAGVPLDAADLQRHCRERIAGYKCPRSIEARDALPMSAAGKVLKQALRDSWRDGATNG